MKQACLADPVQIGFKLFPRNQLVTAINVFRETVCVADVIEYGEEDDKQLFIKFIFRVLFTGFRYIGCPSCTIAFDEAIVRVQFVLFKPLCRFLTVKNRKLRLSR